MHADTQRLAEDVPAGHLKAGDHRAVHMAALVGHPLVQGCRDGPDLTRIAPQDQLFELVDGRLAGPGEAVQGSLADTVHAIVGEHPDEQPVLPAGPDREGLDVHDLHTRAPLAPCA